MAFVWPEMIQAEVVTSHPVMHAHSINGDLLSLVSKPAKLFSEIYYTTRVFRQKRPLFCGDVSITVTSIEIKTKAEFFFVVST